LLMVLVVVLPHETVTVLDHIEGSALFT